MQFQILNYNYRDSKVTNIYGLEIVNFCDIFDYFQDSMVFGCCYWSNVIRLSSHRQNHRLLST